MNSLLHVTGVVKQDCNDFSYIIEDSTRMCERIWREDIITDYDDANQIIQVKQLFLLRKLNGKLLTHQISLKFCKDIVSQKLIHVFSEELKYSWFKIEIYPFIS